MSGKISRVRQAPGLARSPLARLAAAGRGRPAQICPKGTRSAPRNRYRDHYLNQSDSRIQGCVRLAAGIVGLCLVFPASAHDIITTKITWSREVSRIVYKRCLGCHREGGSAFSLATYEEARPWAKAIKEEVLARRMPPWNAVKGFGDLRDDQGLTQEDLDIIANWVEGGAPEGNPSDMPKPPGPALAKEPPKAAQIAVSGSTVLRQAVHAIGIQGTEIPDGVLQVIAEKPDGSIVPLIWIQQFNPKFHGIYYFRDALNLPAGTKLETLPPKGGARLLINPGSASQSASSAGKSQPKLEVK